VCRPNRTLAFTLVQYRGGLVWLLAYVADPLAPSRLSLL
jgi:hypothetical protein